MYRWNAYDYVREEANLRRREIKSNKGWKRDYVKYGECIEIHNVVCRTKGVHNMKIKLDYDERQFQAMMSKEDFKCQDLMEGCMNAIAEIRRWMREAEIFNKEMHSYDPQEGYLREWIIQAPYLIISESKSAPTKRLRGAVYASRKIEECKTREEVDAMRKWLWGHTGVNKWHKWGERAFLKAFDREILKRKDFREMLSRREEILHDFQ